MTIRPAFMRLTATFRTGCMSGPHPSGWLPPSAWATSAGPMVLPGPRSSRSASMVVSSSSGVAVLGIGLPHCCVESIRQELASPHHDQHSGRCDHEKIGAHKPSEIGEREEERPLTAIEVLAGNRTHGTRLAG